ncbi:excinuclease ABC subunit C [Paenibacillus sp. 2RAB27]|uniref:excinuclease ABC subunit C n=1 Tax=Paenibacillus sp. 2RAB27 TaxID=3232991 RepID=UPI003F962640
MDTNKNMKMHFGSDVKNFVQANWLNAIKEGILLTEDELIWLRKVLEDDYVPGEIAPSYFYKKNTERERNVNKRFVREELDKLRKKSIKFTPEELIELSKKNIRESRGIENFSGIYIIHNRTKDMYYAGQAVRVFDRAYQHFVKNPALIKGRHVDNVRFKLREVYEDFLLGDEFNISLLPIENTTFSSLNELEDNAIRAYDSLVPNGYNRNPGNVMDKPIFKNDDFQIAANLMLDKIKGVESLSLLNKRERIVYIRSLLSELKLPINYHFILNLAQMTNKKFLRNDKT